MRFATLVALAVVVSSTPGLAAPAPFAPNRGKPGSHHAHPELEVLHARAVTADHPSHPAHPGPHHNHPGHAAHARAVSSDILQFIESAFDSLPLAKKRDATTSTPQDLIQEISSVLDNFKRDLSFDDYQGLLESLGLSGSGSTIDKRLKLPEISPSTESAIEKAANVATIGGGIAKIWDAIDGSSSSSKRDEIEFDERSFKIPASVTTWLKTIGNVGSIGAGGAAIVGALDGGSNSTLKREFVEADERAFKIPASVTTWLKTLGNVGSIGAGGAAIVGALDGGSNSSILKRELHGTFDGVVDFTTLLNGTTLQFEERGKTSIKPSSSETSSTSTSSGGGDLLSKIAGGFSVLGTGATLLSDLENNTKRELNTDIYGIGPERLHIVNTLPTFDERALKIPASVTTWLKTLGNIGSIGAGGAAVVGAVDGSSDSTMKREVDETFDEVNLTTLLNGVAPQFEDRSVSSSEVSGLESFLGKAATAASVGGALASVWSALDPKTSSTTSKRDVDTRSIFSDVEGLFASLLGGSGSESSGSGPTIAIKRNFNFTLTPEEEQRIQEIGNEPITELNAPVSIFDSPLVSERSIISSAEGILAQLLGGLLGGSGGISLKRSTYDSDPDIADVLTPEEIQQVLTQLSARMVDLD